LRMVRRANFILFGIKRNGISILAILLKYF